MRLSCVIAKRFKNFRLSKIDFEFCFTLGKKVKFYLRGFHTWMISEILFQGISHLGKSEILFQEISQLDTRVNREKTFLTPKCE